MSDLDRLAEQVAARAAGLVLYARQWLDPAGAEDVVQDALASLLGLHKPPDDPAAWMFRVVRNAAVDMARSTQRRRKREERAAMTRREWFMPATDALVDAQAAESALKNLPRELGEVIVLRIWGQMGFAQIASIVGGSVSTAHDRYTSGLRQLRIELEKPCRTKTD